MGLFDGSGKPPSHRPYQPPSSGRHGPIALNRPHASRGGTHDIIAAITGRFSEADTLPLVQRLTTEISLEVCFRRLAHHPGCLWLDSASSGPDQMGRYSFLTADPVETLRVDRSSANPWPRLAGWADLLPKSLHPELPPFQGGIAGLFGYEAARWLEQIGTTDFDDLPTPALCLGLYDWVIAEDHQRNERWLISQGLPEIDEEARRHRAHSRREQVLGWLAEPASEKAPLRRATPAMPDSALAPQFATPRDPKLTSNFHPARFRQAIQSIVESICDGDCFQVNLAQRLLYPQTEPAADLYLRLRDRNPAPMGGFFDGGDFQVLSSSPEGFLRVRERTVETRPIKGTVPRTGNAQRDAELVEQLSRSEKDRAENVMIVDLMRNDLARSCTDSSIAVDKLCAVEPYAYVQHLVSVVRGELREDASCVDLIEGCYPGGSVTGAPKIEAMRKISRLEPTARGPYCGALGYLGCGETVDLNILIRTVTAAHGWLQIPVGGGITAGSDPVAEEQETWHKAEGMLRAILR